MGERERVRQVPPPAFLVACAAGAAVLEKVHPSPVYDLGSGIQLLLASPLFALAAFLAISAAWTLKKSGNHVATAHPPQALVQSGAFRYSRHPMYLALLLLMLGIAVALASAWFAMGYLALWGLLEILAIQPEERMLESKFGEAYRQYRSQVRKWF